MMPTQSALRAYDTSHLTEHATHWRDLAARRRSVVGAVNAQAGSLDWAGQGDEAMKAAMQRHLSTAEEEAGLLDSAAQTAQGGASVLHQQQQSILSAVDQARQSGFAVGEDWSTIDTMYTPGSMGWYARQPTAQTISADLRTQATAFAGQELQTATDVTSAAGDLGGEGAVRGHIQAVGHGFKTDGGNGEPGAQADQPTDLGGLLGAPPGNSFVDQYQREITAPPAPPSAAPAPMPASPPPGPPGMRAAPPPGAAPVGPPEVNPTIGGFLGTAGPGCVAGAADGGSIAAIFPPLIPLGGLGGCLAGGVIAGGGYLGGIWVDNMLNGNG